MQEENTHLMILFLSVWLCSLWGCCRKDFDRLLAKVGEVG